MIDGVRIAHEQERSITGKEAEIYPRTEDISFSLSLNEHFCKVLHYALRIYRKHNCYGLNVTGHLCIIFRQAH